MKVSELIEKLKTCKQDALVAVKGEDTQDYGWVEEATDVTFYELEKVAVGHKIETRPVVLIT